MKKLLFILSLSLFVMSCTKEHMTKNEVPSYATVEFSVAEQENVKQYDIELSADGKEFSPVTIIFASTNAEDNYKVKVDITRWFKDYPAVFIRIKSIDNDGKTLISPTSMVRNDL